MAVLTEEQSMLKDQAQAWVRDESPVQKFRQMRESGTPKRFDEATWSDISTMGWAGILVPEELGGSGMDYATFGVVLEETGRQLVACHSSGRKSLPRGGPWKSAFVPRESHSCPRHSLR